jgi:hypothetical protein
VWVSLQYNLELCINCALIISAWIFPFRIICRPKKKLSGESFFFFLVSTCRVTTTIFIMTPDIFHIICRQKKCQESFFFFLVSTCRVTTTIFIMNPAQRVPPPTFLCLFFCCCCCYYFTALLPLLFSYYYHYHYFYYYFINTANKIQK